MNLKSNKVNDHHECLYLIGVELLQQERRITRH